MRHNMKTLNLGYKRNSKKQGCYGQYFKVSKTLGVKVLFAGEHTVAALLRSRVMANARREFKNLCKVAPVGLSPKPHSLVIVKHNGYYYAGIKMQHIKGRHPDYTCDDSIKLKKLHDELLEAGIDHSDLHSENIIIAGRKVYAIDFDCVFVDSKKLKKFIKRKRTKA